jgi:hypothetical protein
VDYDDVTIDPDPLRWPLHWSGLMASERWASFDRLWQSVCALQHRYRLPIRSRWWEDEIQVEALAALAAWVDRYDSGKWDDPPGKLALLHEIKRVEALLPDGNEPFYPERDRQAFVRFLIDERDCRRPNRRRVRPRHRSQPDPAGSLSP